ncbi:MAG: glycosyltransferase family 9 protein [Candidatus Omnitrophota bacterium]
MNTRRRAVQKILFITLNNLGDIILTTPVLTELCRSFPGVRIDVVTGKPGLELFRRHPSVGKVILHSSGKSFKARMNDLIKFRKERYDLVVDMKNSLIPMFSGAKNRSGPRFIRRACGHKKNEHLDKLSFLGLDRSDKPGFFMPIRDEDKAYIDNAIGPEGKKIIVISPGAKSHLKRWDAKKFAALSDIIIEKLGRAVFIIGSEDDRQTVGALIAHMKNKAVNMCGKTSLGALAELIKRGEMIITNDSAPLHIASAVNAKTIAIFGPSDEKKYGPLAEKSRVLTSPADCRPCSKALCSRGPDEGCISEIGLEEVLAAVEDLVG